MLEKLISHPLNVRSNKPSEYSLRYLGAHLYASGRYQQLYQVLLSKEWVEIIFARIGGRSYLENWYLAITKLSDPITKEQSLLLLLLVIAKTVAISRIRQFSTNHLRTLIRLGQHNIAINHVVMLPDDFSGEKCEALVAIYQELRNIGISRLDLMDAALQAAENIGDPGWRTDRLRDLAERYYQIGDMNKFQFVLHQAMTNATIQGTTHDTTQNFANIAEMLGRIGHLDEAVSLVKKINDEKTGGQFSAFPKLIGIFAQAEKFDEVEKFTSEIKSIQHKVAALEEVVRHSQNPKFRKKLALLVEDVHQSTSEVSNLKLKIEILLGISRIKGKLEDRDGALYAIREATENLRNIQDNWIVKNKTEEIARTFAGVFPLENVEAFASRLPPSLLLQEIQKALLRAKAEKGIVPDNWDTLDPDTRRITIIHLVDYFLESGEIELAENYSRMEKESNHYRSLSEKIAYAFSLQGNHKRATDILNNLPPKPVRHGLTDNVLFDVLTMILAHNRHNYGEQLISLIKDPFLQAKSYCSLAINSSEKNKKTETWFRNAAAIIDKIPENDQIYPGRRDQAIFMLSENLARTGYFVDALKTIVFIKNNERLKHALLTVVAYIKETAHMETAIHLFPKFEEDIKIETQFQRAVKLVQKGSLDEAEVVLDQLPISPSLLDVRAEIAYQYARNGDIQRSEKLWSELLKAEAVLSDISIFIKFMDKIGLYAHEAGCHNVSDQAFEIVKKKIENLSTELESVNQKKLPISWQVLGIGGINIRPWHKIKILCDHARFLSKAGHNDQAKNNLEEAQDLALLGENAHARNEPLKLVGITWADIGFIDHAEKVAVAISGDVDRKEVLTSIQKRIAINGDLSRAILYRDYDTISSLWDFIFWYMQVIKEINTEQMVLLEACRLFSWVEPDWNQVGALINKVENK